MSCSHPPAVLSIDGCPAIELPVLTDAFGNKFVDIRMLYAEYKVCTFDPGFMSTASCTSSITYIDGDAGILLYRGYPIEQLVESACFYDVAFLLLHGELPNAIEKESFRREITNHTMVHEKIATMLSSFNHDSDPMNVLCGAVGALAAFYPESANVKDPAMQILACQRLIAKMPTIAAMIHKILLKGQPVTIFGDGEQTRDFTYVDNVVAANLAAMDADGLEPGAVFNVGVGSRTSLNQLYDAMAKLAGVSDRPSYKEPRVGDVRHSLAALDKIQAALGYRPLVDFQTGIAQTFDWYTSHLATS